MSSLPESKDFDELEFTSSKKEKNNELAVKLLKLREHLCSIHEAYNEQVKVALDCIRNQNGRGAVGALSDGKKHISTAFGNFIDECDNLLLLTGKKSLVSYANSSIKADQNNEEILKNAHLRSFGNVATKDQPGESGAPLAKVKEINKKFKRKREKPAGAVTPSPKRISKRKKKKTDPDASTVISEKKFMPCIVDGESEITIRLTKDRTITMPNPSNKIYERIYSIRELLQYLPEYKGDCLYKIFDLLKNEGRITFTQRTFRRHFTKFEKHGILLDVEILRNKEGRPRDQEISELKALNDNVVSHSGHGDNAVKDVHLAIKTKRFQKESHRVDPLVCS